MTMVNPAERGGNRFSAAREPRARVLERMSGTRFAPARTAMTGPVLVVNWARAGRGWRRRPTASLLAVAIAGFLSACCACASRPPAGTASSGTAPAPPPAVDSTGTQVLAAILRGSGLTRSELAALEPGPPRVFTRGVLFTLAEPGASSVFVAGTFNGWLPNQHQLVRRSEAESVWVGFVPLPARGRYLYKYLLDGRRWVIDPANRDRGGDGAGGFASVFIVP